MGRLTTDSENVSFLDYQTTFYKLLGTSPSAHILAESPGKEPFYHEACIYHPATRSVFVTSNQIPSANESPHTSQKQVKLWRIHDDEANSQKRVDLIYFKGIEGAMLNGGVNYGDDNLLFCAQGSRQPEDLSGLISLSIPTDADPCPEPKVVVSSFYGVPFNSVNDVVVDPRDDSIWFTDPQYGFHQGIRDQPQLPNQVYRFDPNTKSIRAVADSFTRPNGICFSPGYDKLYVTDTGAIHGSASVPIDPSGPSHIYSFDVARSEHTSEPFLVNRRLFAYAPGRFPDGIKCDMEGNVFAGCGDGIEVWNCDGVQLGTIAIEGGVANFCFGEKNIIYACNEAMLWKIKLNGEGVRGALLGA